MGSNLSVFLSHHTGKKNNNKKIKQTNNINNNNSNNNNNNNDFFNTDIRINKNNNNFCSFDNFCKNENENNNNIEEINLNNNNNLKNSNNNLNENEIKLNNQNKVLNDITKYTFFKWSKITSTSENELNNDESPPSCRYAHTMTSIGNDIYIFGGYNGGYLNDVHCFDTINKKWKLLKTSGIIPIKRAFHSSWVWGKKLYIYAGFNGKLILNDLYSLNIETLEWKNEITSGNGGGGNGNQQTPKPRFEHTTSLIGNNVYLFGGANDSNWLSDVHILNLETNQWRNITSMISGESPPKRCAHSSTVKGNSIFIFGGYDGNLRLNSIYEFDTIKKRWFNLQSHNTKKMGRAAHSCSIINNDLMLSFGGFEGVKRLNDLSLFNTTTKEWRPTIITGNPPSIRSYHSSCIVNNKMYIFGGFGELNRLNDLYILEPFFPDLTDICILQLLILSKKEQHQQQTSENNKYLEIIKKSHNQIAEQINQINSMKFWWVDN